MSGSGANASATLTNLFGVSPWTSLTNTPAAIDAGGALAAVGTDAIYVLRGNNTTDFWRYNISSKSWDTNLAQAPAAVSNGGSLVAVGSNTLYAFRGGNTADFWKYDIALNTWTTQTTTPSIAAAPAGVTLAATWLPWVLIRFMLLQAGILPLSGNTIFQQIPGRIIPL